MLIASQNGATKGTRGGFFSPSEDAGAAWRPEGNFELLRRLVDEGQVDVQIQASITLERLEQGENFPSLLYCVGLLSVWEDSAGCARLQIPNQIVRRLLYDCSLAGLSSWNIHYHQID